MPATSRPVLTVRVRCGGRLTPKSAGPQLFFSPVRVLCGSGQQHPFRAPQRVQRIAFEIVSSGVSMSSRCRWASSCGSIKMLCRQPCSQLSPERGTSKCYKTGIGPWQRPPLWPARLGGLAWA